MNGRDPAKLPCRAGGLWQSLRLTKGEESPMLRFAIALAAVALVATPSVGANRCRDAKGHFIKCPPHKVAPTKKCRGAGGKFVKCGKPGAKPA